MPYISGKTSSIAKKHEHERKYVSYPNTVNMRFDVARRHQVKHVHIGNMGGIWWKDQLSHTLNDDLVLR